MRKIDKIKADLVGEVISLQELENVMVSEGFSPVESDDELLKFTNYKSELWVKTEEASTGVLVADIMIKNRLDETPTKVEPFHSYEDLDSVLQYFKKNGMNHWWIVGCLEVGLGRRIGDTLSLRWKDFFKADGSWKRQIASLQEEKTGKYANPRINDWVKECLNQYIREEGIDVASSYGDLVVDGKAQAFRKALKKAVEAVGIDYPVSTHSFRKYFGNIMYKTHRGDPLALNVIQTMFAHSDVSITREYIGKMDEDIDKYNKDYSDYLLGKKAGQNIEIKNSPLVAMSADQFRDILSQAFDAGKNGADKFEALAAIISQYENFN